MKIGRTSILLSLLIFFIIDYSIVTADNVQPPINDLTEVTTPANQTNTAVPLWAGFTGCLIASLFFGSNFIPVKKYSAGDGFFFQFVCCIAIWIVGLVLDRIIDNKRFYPLVLVGGVLWTTGNLATVFCIKTCGLSVGLLIWGTTSLVMGWAGGRFGIFGVKAQVPPTNTKLIFNYLGVIFATASGVFFLFIKSTTKKKEKNYVSFNNPRNSVVLNEIEIDSGEKNEGDTDFPFLNRMSDQVQKVVGCSIAAVAGLFYGLMFIPDQYIRDHKQNFTEFDQIPPDNGLYYIHSQYSGILLASFVYFVIYAAFKRNKPSINPEIVLPGMISGIMWGIANIGFIVAISSLSGAVAYPIVSVLPGLVSSLWSLFLFKEIQGLRNYIILACGMIVRILAAVFSGLSS